MSLIFLHVPPRVLHDIAAASSPMTPRFWDLVYEHQLEMLSPEDSEAVLILLWLFSEGDVMWENAIDRYASKSFLGPHPPGCRLCLDADGAAAMLKCFEREPIDRKTVMAIWRCGAERAWESMDDLEDFVWRNYRRLELLVRRAVDDRNRILAALAFSEPTQNAVG